VWPGRQRADEKQDQNNQENGIHTLVSPPGHRAVGCFRGPLKCSYRDFPLCPNKVTPPQRPNQNRQSGASVSNST
jgi:hypothetical protein